MNQGFNKLNLSKEILKALENIGFKKPSEVQSATIPQMLEKKDLIVKSQTGSGKTASFGIPICNEVSIEEKFVQGIILVPTRELALQVKEEISNIGRLKKVRCTAVFGKQPISEQIKELKQRVHIVVGTPGRVADHINKGTLNLDKVKFLVIDEADKMLSMGFISQIKEILKDLPKEKASALFSATIPEEIEELCTDYMKNPKILDIKSKIFNKRNIDEKFLPLDLKDKFKALWKVLYSKNPKSAIVFCNTKDKVKEVCSLLKREGVLAEELHGDMDQKNRFEVVNNFKNHNFKVLVATDVAARGIHIDDISLVINYEVPMERESYVHRIGRTGRAGNSGEAISFVATYEKRFLNEIEEYRNYKIAEMEYPKDEEVKLGKDLFKESQRDLIKLKNVVRKQEVHKDITKIHISGGKKKKLRALDIVGCFSNLQGMTGEDIGIIDIQDGFSYVDILNGKGNNILRKYKEVTIKNKKIKIQRARN